MIMVAVSALMEKFQASPNQFALNILDARDTKIKNTELALSWLRRLDNSFTETGQGCYVRL
jgi:hypothetical protein